MWQQIEWVFIWPSVCSWHRVDIALEAWTMSQWWLIWGVLWREEWISLARSSLETAGSSCIALTLEKSKEAKDNKWSFSSAGAGSQQRKHTCLVHKKIGLVILNCTICLDFTTLFGCSGCCFIFSCWVCESVHIKFSLSLLLWTHCRRSRVYY